MQWGGIREPLGTRRTVISMSGTCSAKAFIQVSPSMGKGELDVGGGL